MEGGCKLLECNSDQGFYSEPSIVIFRQRLRLQSHLRLLIEGTISSGILEELLEDAHSLTYPSKASSPLASLDYSQFGTSRPTTKQYRIK